MTLSQIKKEINALKRQYAVPLAVVRIRRLAHDFCNQWETAREEGKPTMHTNPVRPVVHPEGKFHPGASTACSTTSGAVPKKKNSP